MTNPITQFLASSPERFREKFIEDKTGYKYPYFNEGAMLVSVIESFLSSELHALLEVVGKEIAKYKCGEHKKILALLRELPKEDKG